MTLTPLDEARRLVLTHSLPLRGEKIDLTDAHGRVLARECVAEEDLPREDQCATDGFAVAVADTIRASSAQPVLLTVAGESSAGYPHDEPLTGGQAVQVTTGALLPAGADAVLALDQVTVTSDDHLVVNAPATPGRHVRPSGNDVRKGDVVLPAGRVLDPPSIGLLAALGMRKVHVTERPRVHILSTGDELAEVGEDLRPGQVYGSSAYALAAYAKEEGCSVTIAGLAPDRRKRLRKMIAAALEDCDVLLLTGGTAAGRYDHVAEALGELGVKIVFHGVNIRPGRPAIFGTAGQTLVFGMPGNPFSTYVTFLQLVRPALRALLGRPDPVPSHLQATLEGDIVKQDKRRHFVAGVAKGVTGGLRVKGIGEQHSGRLAALTTGNCLIVVPEQTDLLRAGESVEIELLRSPV
jgi:molybdopterin molybdotransferase